MDVRAVMTTDPEACLPTDSCAAAGAIMLRRNCGFVPIIDNAATKRVIGVVTDRDLLLHLVQTNSAPESLPVKACMTSPAKTIQADADFMAAAALMESAAIQRVPVVEGQRLVGVLSLKDLALVARREWSQVGPHQVEQQVTDIVEAIAAAR
jgi:CBS domain-containing protein